MSNQQAVVVLDVGSWFFELQTLYRQYNPHNPMEFIFEDFIELTDTVMNVMHSPLGNDRQQFYLTAIHMFSNYIPYDSAVTVVERYIQQLNTQLEHTNASMLPTLNLKYRSWITSSYHLYIAYDNRDPISNQPEYTREGLLLAIEHGDFVNERLRREYGL